MKNVLLLLLVITIGYCQAEKYATLFFHSNEDTNIGIRNDLNITINLSNLNLNSIPHKFISSPILVGLDLSNNNIDSLDRNAFVGLPNLKYLNLSNNKIDLMNIFFNRYPNLEILSLDNNYVYGHNMYVSEDNFYNRNTGNYYYKRLYNLHIQTIYPNLKKLFIRNHDIPLKLTINNLELNFPSLTHLYLSGSKIVNDEFDWLPKTLEYLDLSGHTLESLTLKNLINLKRLVLDDSESTYFKRISFENLENLEYLHLSSNKISEIMPNIFMNITSLLGLDLSNNDITFIYRGVFDSMKNLQILNISNNNIDIIQNGSFDELSQLHTLLLENNSISTFPIISKDIKLKILTLNCNSLESIIGGSFATMPYLEKLYLHSNEIAFIDTHAFAGLNNLKILTLSNNKLSSLPNNWMLPLTQIKYLYLSNNHIVEFGQLSLSDSSPLQYLYLSNELSVFRSVSLMTSMPENVTILLNTTNNDFVQNCNRNNVKYDSYLSTTTSYD